ncbi:hypothetical protein LbDm2_1175 [Levilactobacillus brevis]|nr:hypothetical protein LbDm2_1175 [Levilactobacillus brevis]
MLAQHRTNHCYHDLERWLADKKKRERRAKKHGVFYLENKKKTCTQGLTTY